MFTGLIEETGIIKESSYSEQGCVLDISCKEILSDLKVGSSVAVNGICLTVTKISSNSFSTEISSETLTKTNFNSIKKGNYVNLERALQYNGRLDGHIVSGHIDCFARFIKFEKEGFSTRCFFEIQKEFNKYLVYKGSVAINGISLTVANIDGDVFSVVIIPTTLKNTNLQNLKTGDLVNIETDILAKYVEKFLSKSEEEPKITEEFLLENGF